MHPVADDAMPGHAFGLRELGLVVREHVVGAAGVDVEPLAEERHRHRRALDVPAREARAPGAWPDLEAVLAGRLPQGEVAGAPPARIDLAPRPHEKLVCGVS